MPRRCETLELPHLEKLLARLAPGEPEAGSELSLSMPYERVLAREFGLPADDGRIPWAAWQVREAGRRRGRPRLGLHHAVPLARGHRPCGHGPSAATCSSMRRTRRTLLAAMQPYFEADGIALEYDAPTLLAGARRDLPRPAHGFARPRGGPHHRRLDAAHPAGRAAAAPAAGDADAAVHAPGQRGTRARRAAAGQLLLDQRHRRVAAARTLPRRRPACRSSTTCAMPPCWATGPPGPRHGSSWMQRNARACCRPSREGRPVAVTLCGERSARTWSSAGAGWLRRLSAPFARKQAAMLLEPL